MSADATTELLHKFRTFLTGLQTAEEVVARIAKFTARVLKCDEVEIYYQLPAGDLHLAHPQGRDRQAPAYTLAEGRVSLGTLALTLPVFFSDAKSAQLPAELLAAHAARGTRSAGLVPIVHQQAIAGWLECRYLRGNHRWRKRDTFILQKMAEFCAAFVDNARPAPADRQPETRENVFRRVMESSPWVIMDVMRDGRIAYVSAKVEELAGVSAEDVRGRDVFAFLDTLLVEVYKAEAFRCIKRVLAGRTAKAEFFSEVVNRKSFEGRHFLFQVESGLPEADHLVVVITDVTANKIYREKLDEAKLRSMRLVEYGNLIIIRTDPALRITDVLGDTDKIFGVSSRMLLYDAQIWTRFGEAVDLRTLRRLMKRMREARHQFSHEIRVRNQRSGELRWVLLNAVPLFSSSGQFSGWEGFGLDITDKRRTEEELLLQS